MSSFRDGAWVLTVGLLLGVFVSHIAKGHASWDRESMQIVVLSLLLGFFTGVLGAGSVETAFQFRLKRTGAYDGISKSSPPEALKTSELTTPEKEGQPSHAESQVLPGGQGAQEDRKKPPATHQKDRRGGHHRRRSDRTSRNQGPSSRTPTRILPPTSSDQPSSTQPGPNRLIDVWEAYLEKGDGHFNASGLQNQLTEEGVTGRAISGQDLGADDSILGVDFDDGLIYLLPNFSKSPRAVEKWFDDRTGGTLIARIKRVDELAVVLKTAIGIEVKSRGIVG